MASSYPPLVHTTSGPVRGRRDQHGSTFLGIPYAAPPVGPLRFAAPRPHDRWTEVRDATRFGPTAPQPVRDTFGVLDMRPYYGPGWVPGEDYLTVNVWAPEGAVAATALTPVMVFVHGGGFVAGSNRAALYDGTAFARDGVVLVTVNYRLGVPGFLHLPDAPDNRGLLDVLAALRWVQENISRFGGDPDDVTLFGQSAGATLVGAVLADPAATGLLHRAVMQSGNGVGAFSREQAGIVGAAIGRELGSPVTARALSEVSDRAVVDLLPRLRGLDLSTPTSHDPLGGISVFAPVLDVQPADAVAAGRGIDVDLLIGVNADEGSLYLAPLGLLPGSTDDDVTATAARFHRDPDQVVARYRAARPATSAAQLRIAVLGDGLFGDGTRRMAGAHAGRSPGRTFEYEFTWASDAVDGLLGSAHTVELPFVFDVVHLPALHGPGALLGTAGAANGPSDASPDGSTAGLAGWMHRAWIRFAATGDPGWAASEPGRPHVRQIGPLHVSARG